MLVCGLCSNIISGNKGQNLLQQVYQALLAMLRLQSTHASTIRLEDFQIEIEADTDICCAGTMQEYANTPAVAHFSAIKLDEEDGQVRMLHCLT